MSKITASPRGCPDWLPDDFDKAQLIIEKAKHQAKLYGFKGYQTPIFEHAEVFTKTLGDSSDVVTKEMYSFSDKNDELFVLRPEATAPLVRLFLSHKLKRELPLKMFTFGPMFRYERPQKGRQRQFHQIGIEHLGAPTDLFTEFECISFGWNFLQTLNITSKLKVLVNALGSSSEREEFKKSLINYLTPLKTKLSEDSKKRLETNPLRILDSKSKEDIEILKEAPKITDFISKKEKEKTTDLIATLNNEGITAELSPQLVRGLDYYNGLVFEIIALEGLGAQSTVLAGGRYDQLVESMGGEKTNAIGWGCGLERIMLLSEIKIEEPKSLGLVMNTNNEKELIRLSHKLRKEIQVPLFTPLTGNLSKRFQKSQKAGVDWAVIVGEEELKNKSLSLKNFSTGNQENKSEAEAFDFLKELFCSDS